MSVVKEIIISLLTCFLVLLGLSVVLYKFIPNNKIIPEEVKYQANEDVKKELQTEINQNTKDAIKTYTITASDLEQYQKAKEYNPGRKNPFAPVEKQANDTTSGETTSGASEDNNSGTTSGNPSSSNSNSSNSSGSLFEKPGTK